VRHHLVALALLAPLLATPALGFEVAGVKVPDSVTAGGKTLKLNGAGIRKKSFLKVKVYVGALYLETASSDPAAIVAADAAKSVHMVFLRDVDKEKIMGAFRDGFEANGGEAVARALAPRLDKVGAVVPAEIKEGQELVVTYLPGKGTTVSVSGGSEVTVEGKDFADAMFKNWLGEEPADGGLKERMLGKE
jgi:hypothetical protein